MNIAEMFVGQARRTIRVQQGHNIRFADVHVRNGDVEVNLPAIHLAFKISVSKTFASS